MAKILNREDYKTISASFRDEAAAIKFADSIKSIANHECTTSIVNGEFVVDVYNFTSYEATEEPFDFYDGENN